MTDPKCKYCKDTGLQKLMTGMVECLECRPKLRQYDASKMKITWKTDDGKGVDLSDGLIDSAVCRVKPQALADTTKAMEAFVASITSDRATEDRKRSVDQVGLEKPPDRLTITTCSPNEDSAIHCNDYGMSARIGITCAGPEHGCQCISLSLGDATKLIRWLMGFVCRNSE